jgi:hypothetical protein
MEIKKLFDDNFDFEFKATTYNNMKVAIQSFVQFKKNNEDFFSFDKRETLFGYLLTYAIEKQFNDSAFNPKANYAVSMKQVNNYKYKALCIETNDFIVNVGRTNGKFKLLPVSAYKKELAKANNGLSMQLSFDFFSDVQNVVEAKKYAEITYGYRYDEMTHLNIVLPSGDYKTIEYSTNLLENISIYENYIPQDLVEESIVSLKKSISKEIEKII